MTLNKFVFKSHKWLAVAALIASALWFVSGIAMVTPKSVLGSRHFSEKAQPDDRTLRDATISVAQAIGVADAAAGKPVKVAGVELRMFAGRAVYVVTSNAGVFLVDATDGSRLVIDGNFAQRVAKRYAGQSTAIRGTSLLRERNSEYRWGPLPVWRVAFEDTRGTLFFVTEETGEVSWNDRHGRLRDLLSGWHRFDFLQVWFSSRSVNLVMWVFSVVGTVMTFFGCWILWLQWKLWLAARRARVA